MADQRCNYSGCRRVPLGLKWREGPSYYLDGLWFCSESCLVQQVTRNLERLAKPSGAAAGFLSRPKMSLFLLEAGAVTRAQLDQATRALERSGRGSLAGWLIKLGYTNERDITRAICRQFGLPFVDLTHAQINKAVLGLLPPQIIAAARVFPLEYDSHEQVLALIFGYHVELSITHVIAKMLDCQVNGFIGDESYVVDLIGQHYGITLRPYTPNAARPVLSDLNASDLALQIVEEAKRRGANSLLFEPYNHLLWIRYLAPNRDETVFIDMCQQPLSPLTT